MTDSPPSIAIIGGTGALGGGLAARWARAGHAVIIGSRSPDKAARAAISAQNPGFDQYRRGPLVAGCGRWRL